MKNFQPRRGLFLVANLVAMLLTSSSLLAQAQTDDSLAAALEAARRKRDGLQLDALKTQIEQHLRQNPNDWLSHYQLARVQGYRADVEETKKDKKAASTAIDKAIEAALRSVQLNDESADAHSLLADLYGRKISLSNPMFAGPRYGPKIEEQNKRAMALDDKNPRVWASRGRQYLMTPKAFGGDAPKAIDSFQKSLALDSQQDETWVWLAKAFEKQGDKPRARDAIHHALELNPQGPFAEETSRSLGE
jgi:tetratricopeptide (TPR) repeat protein